LRQANLDLARGASAVAVVIGHAVPALHPVAARAVDVFLVLSGYLCAVQLSANPPVARWIARRLRRVYPAAVAVGLVVGAPWGVLALVEMPARGTPWAHYWSLVVEVVGYVGLAVVALLPRRWWVPALWCAVAACVAGRLVASPSTAYVLRWDGMALGALWGLRALPDLRPVAWALPVALAMDYVVAPLPAAVGAVGCLSLARGVTYRSALSDWACTRSYALYLVHAPCLWAWGWWGLLVALPATEVMYRYVDRPLGCVSS
jgi:peptidoglycan/LPS O-acetylase OafA/YrhL